jgi:hypothetical protein
MEGIAMKRTIVVALLLFAAGCSSVPVAPEASRDAAALVAKDCQDQVGFTQSLIEDRTMRTSDMTLHQRVETKPFAQVELGIAKYGPLYVPEVTFQAGGACAGSPNAVREFLNTRDSR